MPRNILILGASYGSLFATKLLLAGQAVTLVCFSREADLINDEGILVRMPFDRGMGLIAIHSRGLPGKLDACPPDDVGEPSRYDLVCLAMQEPQYGSADVRDLMSRIAASGKPVTSIMNMPPLPFLARIPTLDIEALGSCYTDARVWDGFTQTAFTLASSDPQTFRAPDQPSNVLDVTLATNFKVARFEDPAHTAVLSELGSAIEAARFDINGRMAEVPVKLKVYDSVFVPLAKWSMLLAGNYRCIEAQGIRSIRAAVHSDLAASRDIYDWVGTVLRAIGASDADIVPFDTYASAALNLTAPSSIARALANGAIQVERVDLLVQTVAASEGMHHPGVDAITEHVDVYLSRHREALATKLRPEK